MCKFTFAQTSLSQKPLAKRRNYLDNNRVIFLLVEQEHSALGNTLFQKHLSFRVLKDFDQTSHFLIRLRIFHPILAMTIWTFQWIASAKNDFIFKVLSYSSWVAVIFGASIGFCSHRSGERLLIFLLPIFCGVVLSSLFLT